MRNLLILLISTSAVLLAAPSGGAAEQEAHALFNRDVRLQYASVDCAATPLPAHIGQLKAVSGCYRMDSGAVPGASGRTRIDRAIGAVNHLRYAQLFASETGVSVSVFYLRLQTMEMLEFKSLSRKQLRMIFSSEFQPMPSNRLAGQSGEPRQSTLIGPDNKVCVDAFTKIDKRRYRYARACSGEPESLADLATKAASQRP